MHTTTRIVVCANLNVRVVGMTLRRAWLARGDVFCGRFVVVYAVVNYHMKSHRDVVFFLSN
jgi:hypothetical protein